MPICTINLHASKPIHKNYPSSLITLADHIKAKRLDLKLSKIDLAKLLKINPLTIGTWENSNKKPVPRMMKKIIDFLEYTPPLGVDKKTFGGQLYIYRCKNGLTQKDIATELKMDRWAVTKIENNETVEKKYKLKIERFLSK